MFLALVLKEDPSPKYDVICTSGTIYNTAYNSALHNTLQTVGLGVNGLPGHQGQLLWAPIFIVPKVVGRKQVRTGRGSVNRSDYKQYKGTGRRIQNRSEQAEWSGRVVRQADSEQVRTGRVVRQADSASGQARIKTSRARKTSDWGKIGARQNIGRLDKLGQRDRKHRDKYTRD
ncbi:unnamed protein product [Oncorhynchus mykiss]|uniref:Uncharacterized protein n=1 Tax=Oncorhynchus mykiss TaxID=8022 RepID=A0A060WGB3_ONCMY|nr:unnamed protein product [Oncorhynchus mykiss]